MDVALLIEPEKAAAYEEATRPPPVDSAPSDASDDPNKPSETADPASSPVPSSTDIAKPTHFWASAELDPVTASLKFASIMRELVELFSARHGTNVVVKVDIEASDDRGFDETTVRAAKENSRVLGITSMDFD